MGRGTWLCAVLFIAAGCIDGAPPETAPLPSDEPQRSRFIPAENTTDGLPDYRPPPDRIESLRVEIFGDAPNGVRMKLWNDRAYVTTGTSTDGIGIFDITDPFEPERLGSVTGIGPREGLAVLNYGERVVLAVSVGGFDESEMVFIDVTDPTLPVELKRIPVTSHILGALGSAKVVYNAGWPSGGGGGTEIIDARDPDDIKIHKKWMWGAAAQDGTPVQPTICHDIIVDQQAARAYCAAQGQTTVWDLKDPLEPVILKSVNHAASVPHHNTAFPILDGRVLVIGNEMAGCGPTQVGTRTPTGLWFYDLTTTPATPLSWLSVPSEHPGVYGFCAPHFGSEVGPGTGYVAFGWFDEGVVLVDASDPENPVIVDRNADGGTANDAVYYRGLVFAAGQKGGLQVVVPE